MSEARQVDLGKLREERGLSQRRLAQFARISRARLRRIERGSLEEVTFGELQRIGRVLGMEMDDLLEKATPADDRFVLSRAGEVYLRFESPCLGYQMISLLPVCKDLFLGKIFILPKKKMYMPEQLQQKRILLFLLMGGLQVQIGGQKYELKPGDRFLFKGKRSDSLENPHLRESVVLVVTVPSGSATANTT